MPAAQPHQESGSLPRSGRGKPEWYAGHLPVLDGTRGIAVLMVMVYHFTTEDAKRGGALGSILNGIGAVGRLGVDLFFVLSGFLITGILLDRKSSPGYFRTFYARRVLRIFPLYYLALAIVFFAVPAILGTPSPSLGYQSWAWLYCTNVAITFFGIGFPYLFHFWSLAIEEHFYMLWPWVVWRLSFRNVAVATLVLVLIAICSRIWLSSNGYSQHFFTPARFDALALGAVLALLVRSDRASAILERYARTKWLLLGMPAVILPYAAFKALGLPLISDSVRYLGIALVFAGFLALAIAAQKESLLYRLLSLPLLVAFGKYSYGLYVYHAMIQGALDEWLPSDLFVPYVHFLPVAIVVKVVIDTAISFAIALVSWNLFEQPILKLKKHFEYRDKPAPATAEMAVEAKLA